MKGGKKEEEEVNKAIGQNKEEEEEEKVKATDVDEAHVQVYMGIFVH